MTARIWRLLSWCYWYVTLVWTTIQIPTAWLYANITCSYKNWTRKFAANYRGLSIGTNMSRILAEIIISQLQKSYEKHISEAQNGFRQNRSTNDAIFVVKSIIEQYGDTLVAVYIDFTAYYDHEISCWGHSTLEQTPSRIFQKMYEGTTASTLWHEGKLPCPDCM